MKCGSCMSNHHSQCWDDDCNCTHEATPVTEETEELDGDNLEDEESERYSRFERVEESGRREKRDSSLKDIQSTGRKRAARMYPLISNSPCEWRGLANCGGGKFPILGCLEGVQTDRHHGPDKVVTNNEDGNVHRICSGCHHAWHAKNNPDYDWNTPNLSPHDPREMTLSEQFEAAKIAVKRRYEKVKKIRD